MPATDLRIIFMGTPEFAVPTLSALLAAGEQVVAVVTQPDRPKGRGRKLTPPPVKILAEQAGIPVLQPTSIRGPAFLQTIENLAPDLLVVTAYGRILPGDLLRLPRHGTINVHASLLPKYRGAAPIQWAIINGEPKTGVTIMQMDEGMDTGDILLPATININADETAASLAPKLADLGGQTLVQALGLLRRNALQPIKQDDRQATLAPLLKKEDGRIDWSRTADQLSCQIRGLDPWPGTSVLLAGTRLKLFAPRVVAENSLLLAAQAPGTICHAAADGMLVATGKDLLLIAEVQPEGGRRMPTAAFLQGHPVTPGTMLES